MIGHQQRLQINCRQLDLVALWRHNSRRAARFDRLRQMRGGLHCPSTEQTRLGLLIVPDRRSAHALRNASGARFAHTF